MPLKDQTEGRFAELLDEHLKKLKISRRDFLQSINIVESQFYRWKTNASSPSRTTVNKIAAALAERYEQVKKGEGIGNLEFLLSDLLQAAGYLAFPGYSETTNRTWHSVKFSEPRSWVLGWINCPPWAHPSGAGPAGISIVVAQYVSQLLGIEDVRWEQLEWENFVPNLTQGKVHALCPMLINHPSRRWDVAFAGRLPVKISLGVLTRKGVQSDDLPRDVQSLHRLQLFYVPGEIGEAARYLLFGGGSVQSFQNLDEAAAALDSARGPKIPILVSEATTCDTLANTYKLQAHREWDLLKFLNFGVSFGISPYEPMLRRLLDDAVGFLKESPLLTDLYKSYNLELATQEDVQQEA